MFLAMAVYVTTFLRLWRAHFRIPWEYVSDGNETLESIQSIMQSGWNLHTPRVGAPFVGSQVDFPAGGESFHWLTLKLLGYVLRSPALTDNFYYLAGYFLIALVAYYVARYLGLGRAPAFLVAVLYSFLPYHQVHRELHVTRSAYYLVPLVVLVMLWLVSWRTELYEATVDGTLRLRRRRLIFAAAVCVIQGVSDTITSGFAVSLFLLIGLLVAVGHRNWRPLRWGVIFAVAVGGTLLLANLPYLVARLTEGPNLTAGVRVLSDQEYYGLRWVFMLLPIEHHIGGVFAHLTDKAREGGVGEPGESLGVFGAVGFLVAAVVALATALRPPVAETRLWAALKSLGAIAVVAVLVSSVGGLAYLIALTGFDQLRTWDRMVVIIGFLAAVAFALLVQRLLVRLAAVVRRWNWPAMLRVTMPGVIVVVLATIGVLDQAPPAYVPAYAATALRWDVDTQFFQKLEASVPKGSMIFQYPVMAFPENGPVANLADYGEFIGYFHTSTLRWSYGAMKGRNQGDWQTTTYASLPITTKMAALSAIGFQGVWVDREGYADHGVAFEAELRPLLGPPALVSADGRMAYYDLGPVTRKVDAQMSPAQRKAFADAVLTAIHQQAGTGFYGPEVDPDGLPANWAQKSAQLDLDNLSSRTETVHLTGRVEGNGPGTLAVSARSSSVSVPMSTSAANPINLSLQLPPGKTTVKFSANVPAQVTAPGDLRQLWFRVAGVKAIPTAAYNAMCTFEPAPTRPLDCP